MTAFAAIVSDRRDDSAVARVADALAVIGGAIVRTSAFAGCTLLESSHAASNHPSIVGTIRLEDRRGLAARLDVADVAQQSAVVAAAYERWGPECTQRLSGEYAFTLWDDARRTLVCARDGLGIRLLYVAGTRAGLIVSNVLGAVVTCAPEVKQLDRTTAIEFLAGSGDVYRTIYRDVAVLPEGHTLVVRNGTPVALTRHWHMPAPAVTWRGTADVIEGYRAVLQQAVWDRVGADAAAILQSGGIDSGTVAAAATVARNGPLGLHAFVSEYRRFADTDEVPCAARTCDALGIPLTVVPGDAFDPLFDDEHGPLTPEPYDEPSLADWRALLRAAAAHAPVTLNGEDGDALFAPPIRGQVLANGGAVVAARGVLSHVLQTRSLPAVGLRNPPPRPGREIVTWLRGEAEAELAAAASRRVLGFVPTPLPGHPTRPRTQARLSPDNLRSFAATLAPETTRARTEITLPLMDRRVIEYVFSSPPIPWSQQKRLARDAYADVLPADIRHRPKRPVYGFFERAVAFWREQHGTEPVLPPGLEDLVDEPRWRCALRHGPANSAAAAWRVLTLAAWLTRAGLVP